MSQRALSRWLPLSALLAQGATATPAPAPAAATRDTSKTIWATPHDSYSSSIGVLGCKIDTDRVAYWPSSISCDSICVEVTHSESGRKVKLLRIDQSQGAHDMSYDAWNYLVTGKSATEDPTAGGTVEMTTKDLDASECASLIHTSGHKVPLSAANSMNFLANCLDNDPDSYVAKNYVLYNIADAICSYGLDEECDLDWPTANQATCPHTMGDQSPLDDKTPVYNIRYPTGEKVKAASSQVVVTPGTGDVDDTGTSDDDDMGVAVRPQNLALGVAFLAAAFWPW
ncbi:hypothetical protein GMORB2_7256 [Geosmithia morbida]|uniref:Cerato-platanin n=1 Tax=Geosmithia morbida TaxID=1094350 RepID=A0A9P4YWE2_9HYPO|nr:uncharacterized protein GMORB2_7256 [Geosmithia morbida]KAF4122264.1 hypothetical protein GMORB2_7256 [Geosmithia morbida]